MRDTKSDHFSRGSAPDFTQACIVMFGVNVVWVLLAVFVIWGFLPMLAIAFGVKKLVDTIEARRG